MTVAKRVDSLPVLLANPPFPGRRRVQTVVGDGAPPTLTMPDSAWFWVPDSPVFWRAASCADLAADERSTPAVRAGIGRVCKALFGGPCEALASTQRGVIQMTCRGPILLSRHDRTGFSCESRDNSSRC